MSESYPDDPEQPLPSQDQAQSFDQPQGQAEDELITEPTLDEGNVEPDTRWDQAKAETLASVLKADGSLDSSLKQIAEKEQYVNSEQYLDDNLEPERQRLEAAQRTVADAELVKPGDGVRRVAEAQADYDKAVGYNRVAGQIGLEKARGKVENVVNEVLSPYQELYDRNPAVFADMPTAKFMSIVEEFSEIGSQAAENESNSQSLAACSDKIRAALEQKKTVDWDVIINYSREIAICLDLSSDEWNEVRQKFELEMDDSFDKTRRQTMEGFLRIGGEYTSQFEAKKLADARRSQELLDKYGPTDSNPGQN